MSDERTAEQRAADDALAAAIERCARVHGRIPDEALMTEWVVLGGGMTTDPAGRDVDLSFLILPEGGATTPWRHLLGLVQVHRIQIEEDFRRERTRGLDPDDDG